MRLLPQSRPQQLAPVPAQMPLQGQMRLLPQSRPQQLAPAPAQMPLQGQMLELVLVVVMVLRSQKPLTRQALKLLHVLLEPLVLQRWTVLVRHAPHVCPNPTLAQLK